MHSHKKLAARAAGVLALTAALGAGAESANLLSSTEEPGTVSLQAEGGADGTVNGTIRNGTGGTLQNIQVLVRHDWLWQDEYNPGADDPARLETMTVTETIAPGATHTFTYQPSPALPSRTDGRFVTRAELGAYEVVTGG
jgi:hypothetical protein